jgi:hypothetical protein
MTFKIADTSQGVSRSLEIEMGELLNNSGPVVLTVAQARKLAEQLRLAADYFNPLLAFSKPSTSFDLISRPT